MNLAPTPADDKARWPAVVLTLLGVAIIGYVAFVARALDMLVGAFFASDTLGLPMTTIVSVGMVRGLILVSTLPLFGLLSDLTNRRVWPVVGTLLLGAGTMAKAAATSPPSYLAGEIGYGLGLAMLLPAAIALPLEICGARARLATAAGGVALVQSLAWLAVPLPVSLAERSGWRFSHGVMGGAILVGAALGGLLLWSTRDRKRRPPAAERPADPPPGQRWALVVVALLLIEFPVAIVSGVMGWLRDPFYKSILQATPAGREQYVGLAAFAVAVAVVAPLLDSGQVPGLGRGRWLRPGALATGALLMCAAALGFRLSHSAGAAQAAMVALYAGSGVMAPAFTTLLLSNVRRRWWGTAIALEHSVGYFAVGATDAGVPWLLSVVGYETNVAASPETIAGIRLILSMTVGVGVLGLALAAAAATIHLLNGRSGRAGP